MVLRRILGRQSLCGGTGTGGLDSIVGRAGDTFAGGQDSGRHARSAAFLYLCPITNGIKRQPRVLRGLLARARLD